MFFQHFITDDFIRYQDVLNKKISIESMIELLRATGEPLDLVERANEFGEVTLHIEISKPDHLLILGKSFNKVDRARKYNSIKTWLNEDGFPVICNVKILREDYPGLHMLNDRLLCLFVYACTFPAVGFLHTLDIKQGEDAIELFCKGFTEYGVLSEFEDFDSVPATKIRYLIMRGREMETCDNAG